MSCCKDVMDSIEVLSCCTSQDTVAQDVRAIRDSRCGCAPVVKDVESPKLVDVVTERVVCCDVAADAVALQRISSEKSCNPNRLAVSPSSRLMKHASNSTNVGRQACPY